MQTEKFYPFFFISITRKQLEKPVSSNLEGALYKSP